MSFLSRLDSFVTQASRYVSAALASTPSHTPATPGFTAAEQQRAGQAWSDNLNDPFRAKYLAPSLIQPPPQNSVPTLGSRAGSNVAGHYESASVEPIKVLNSAQQKPRVVVVVFGGGAWFIPGQSGSSGSPSTTLWGRVDAGGETKGLGETALDAESPIIARKIKNDFPEAEVILAGPDAKAEVLKDLTSHKPDHIIIYGYSRGGVMAVNLTNELNRNGQSVDQLITVDPVNKQFSDYQLEHPGLVKEAVNYYEYPYRNPVLGAKNVIIGPADRDPNKKPLTPVNHDNLDDIASPKAIGKIAERLKTLQR